MTQPARMEMLKRFKNNEFTFMICSDVAARGLDIPALSHVFNFDVPSHAEDYVHRIGRTGRAGIKGHAYTFAVPEDRKYIDAITKLIGKKIPPIGDTRIKDIKSRGKKITQQLPDEPSTEKNVEEKRTITSLKRPKSGGHNQGRGRKRNQNKEPKLEKDDAQHNEKLLLETKPTQLSQVNNIKKFGDSDYVPAFMQRPNNK
jgi:superfamily II DNA/RNA helicase